MHPYISAALSQRVPQLCLCYEKSPKARNPVFPRVWVDLYLYKNNLGLKYLTKIVILISKAMGSMAPLLFFYKNSIAIKYLKMLWIL